MSRFVVLFVTDLGVKRCGAFYWPVQRNVELLYRFSLLCLYNPREGHLQYMEFTAGLGAQDARLTCIPSDNGENRQPGGKKYNRSGSHGENEKTMR